MKLLIFLPILLILVSLQVIAVCPVCTIAVGAGVGVLRAFGIDDIITGLWIGALIVSSIIWLINYLDKKKIKFIFRKLSIVVAFYLIFILPLYYKHIIGVQGNVVFGIDKLLFGIILGSVIFILAVLSNRYLKKINQDKVFIPYQKVFIPVLYLIISSFIIYFLCKII